MTNTKEKILVAALRLFAVNGYEAVSVSQIAGELGMTKGALYKHYKNKRDIFNCIFEYVCQLDVERSQKNGVPEKDYAEMPEALYIKKFLSADLWSILKICFVRCQREMGNKGQPLIRWQLSFILLFICFWPCQMGQTAERKKMKSPKTMCII